MDQQNKILDYGCGLGGNIKFLSDRGEYFGVDLLPENISYAKKRYGDKFFSLVTDSKISDQSYDEVHVYDVLEHVVDLEGTVKELARVLKPGGKIFVTVPAAISEQMLLKIKPEYFKEVGHLRIVDPQELAGEFSKYGFRKIVEKRVRGMEAVVLALVFWLRKNRRAVSYQTGSPEFNKFTVAFIWLFDFRLFRTPLKYLPFVYVFTLPIGWLVSRLFPKAIYSVYQK